jgi:hypothetical protein
MLPRDFRLRLHNWLHNLGAYFFCLVIIFVEHYQKGLFTVMVSFKDVGGLSNEVIERLWQSE